MKYFIKKHLFLFVLPMLILVSSCSDDSCEVAGGANDLVGTWTVTDASFDVLVDGTDFIQWIVASQGLSQIEAQLVENAFKTSVSGFSGTMTFNEDETYSANIGGGAETGVWSLNGSTLSLDPDTVSDGPEELTVVTLNSNSLVTTYSETQSEDLDDDGSDEILTLNFNLTFTK